MKKIDAARMASEVMKKLQRLGELQKEMATLQLELVIEGSVFLRGEIARMEREQRNGDEVNEGR